MVEQRYIIINSKKYDITHFKHPGGNVINYMINGQDATESFNEFHYRSKRAHKILESLPYEKIDDYKPDDDILLKNFKQFREQLIKEGLFEPSNYHIIGRIVQMVFIYGLATYTINYNCMCAAILYGIFGGQCGWLQHEAGHNSLTGIIKLDKLIQEFIMGFGLYGSASKWNRMHNRHHATPQKVGHDMDLNTTPFVAFYKGALEDNKTKKNKYVYLWLKYQMYTFLPITSGILIPFMWRFNLHLNHSIREKRWNELFFVFFGTFLQIFNFMYFGNINYKYGLLYHFISSWVSYLYIFGHFSLSHTTTDIVERHEDPSWVRYAIEHSVDIGTKNPIVSWIMGYLNFQVIHHLFPSMPQYNGGKVSVKLIEFCKENNINYKIIGYRKAWYDMLSNLNSVGHIT